MSNAKINKLIKFIMKAPADQVVNHWDGYQKCAIGLYARSINEEPYAVARVLNPRAAAKGGYRADVMELLGGSASGETMGAVARSVKAVLVKHQAAERFVKS